MAKAITKAQLDLEEKLQSMCIKIEVDGKIIWAVSTPETRWIRKHQLSFFREMAQGKYGKCFVSKYTRLLKRMTTIR